jgi:2-C-methyl-D-erythritol 4-phosphate cytidylyltransferase
MIRAGLVVPAAGAGRRLGGARKPLLELRGEPVLRRALAPFLARPEIVAVAVALGAGDAERPPEWLRTLDARVRLVAGGAERGDSVRAALAALPADLDVILVHDAARPLVSGAVIDRVLAAAAAGRSVIAAVPLSDTVQEVDGSGCIVATPDRARLRAAQTPQGFPAEVLRAAYRQAAREGVQATDDAALVARCGVPVYVVEGAPENLKLTTPHDLRVAEALLDDPDAPVSHG